MSRIRTVKPEYWSHPKVTAVCRDARLLFLGLLNEADDEGRLRWSAKRIAGVVFPEDDDVDARQIDSWCASLEGVGLVARYEVDGAKLLQIVGFLDHQRVSHPTASRLPSITEALDSPPETLANVSRIAPDDVRREGKGKEGKGSARAASAGESFESDFSAWWDQYPRKVNRSQAFKAYQARRREGVPVDDLCRARDNFAATRSGQDPAYTMYGATFLAKDGPWTEWLAGNPDGERSDPDDFTDRLARGLV